MKSYKEQFREKLENLEYPYEDKAWINFKRYRLKKTIPLYSSSIILIIGIISAYVFIKNNEQSKNFHNDLSNKNEIVVKSDTKQSSANELQPVNKNEKELTTTSSTNGSENQLLNEKLFDSRTNNNNDYKTTTFENIVRKENNESNQNQEVLRFYASSVIGCLPFTVKFEAPNITENAIYYWNFGDGTYSTDYNPIHIYKKPGTYTVQLTIKTDKNLEYKFEKQTIIVYPKPKALFDVSLNNNCLDLTCKSKDIINYVWKIKDTIVSGVNVKHCYNKTETIPIQLIVINENECRDTVEEKVAVFYKLPIYFADAFTPDGDGINDVFGPQVSNFEEYYFDVQIFNKVGKCVFSKQGNNVTWDGNDVNTKMPCPSDAYFYKVLAVDKKGNKQEFSGKIQLIR